MSTLIKGVSHFSSACYSDGAYPFPSAVILVALLQRMGKQQRRQPLRRVGRVTESRPEADSRRLQETGSRVASRQEQVSACEGEDSGDQ